MLGEYSPTVSSAYAHDRDWWSSNQLGYNIYDQDGYDAYGYNSDCIDRAGNHKDDYAISDSNDEGDEDCNNAYLIAYKEWGFDGRIPVMLSK